jgi:hypothetical protein
VGTAVVSGGEGRSAAPALAATWALGARIEAGGCAWPWQQRWDHSAGGCTSRRREIADCEGSD